MAQQFVQFPHLREEFPVYLSLREIVVRSGRLQDAFQRSEAAVRSQGISLLRGKYRRWSESDTQGGDVASRCFLLLYAMQFDVSLDESGKFQ